MRSVPFYLAIGNHDVGAMDLATYPDGLAYYYYFDLPLNAPAFLQTVTPKGTPDQTLHFQEAAGSRFPNMANYSFDHGNVHIVCLDANPYVAPFEPELIRWMETDLKASKATWKLVAFHHPGFNSSKAHYNAQWMRALSPVFERAGVNLVLNGHVHNYQRTHPLTFKPKTDSQGNAIIDSTGRVDGMFTLDQDFDGRKKTRPRGVLYVVTGAGGAGLYDTAFSNKPELWKHDPVENWVPFTAKFISHVHLFSVIKTQNKTLTLRQVDVQGNLLDQIVITK
jgi:3',5'-cyclic AMP phosphodiesterase CpdA